MKKIISVICLATIILTLSSCNTLGTVSSSYDNDPNNYDDVLNLGKKKEYWVSFETNGGSHIESYKTSIIEEAPSVSKKEHIFDGWYLDEQLTQPVIFPLNITSKKTLYAKWLRKEKTIYCENACIKFLDNEPSSVIYSITPNGFDFDELSKRNYNMTIRVDYTVYYRKDYDALLDIGYAGSPKYEVYIYNSKNLGISKENVSTTLSKKQSYIELSAPVSSMKNDTYYLKFSTDNIQNKIYFENISVTYTCF